MNTDQKEQIIKEKVNLKRAAFKFLSELGKEVTIVFPGEPLRFKNGKVSPVGPETLFDNLGEADPNKRFIFKGGGIAYYGDTKGKKVGALVIVRKGDVENHPKSIATLYSLVKTYNEKYAPDSRKVKIITENKEEVIILSDGAIIYDRIHFPKFPKFFILNKVNTNKPLPVQIKLHNLFESVKELYLDPTPEQKVELGTEINEEE